MVILLITVFRELDISFFTTVFRKFNHEVFDFMSLESLVVFSKLSKQKTPKVLFAKLMRPKALISKLCLIQEIFLIRSTLASFYPPYLFHCAYHQIFLLVLSNVMSLLPV